MPCTCLSSLSGVMMMESEGKMTTTDARGWINALIKAMHEETSGSWPVPEYKDEVYSALEMALQALSQEPCADAVSRDAVIEATHHCGDLQEVRGIVQQLPSVNPQPSEHFIDGVHAIGYREGYKDAQKQKSGKWLITHLSNMAYCSECDYLFKDIPASVVEHFKYCPDCGCRMVATQEREE